MSPRLVFVSKFKNAQCKTSKGWGYSSAVEHLIPSTTKKGRKEGKKGLKLKDEDSNLIATDY